jgi:hypothetical protein
MTDNILSHSEGSANLPGQGGRMHGGKSSSSDADSRPSKTAQAMPGTPGHRRRSWRPLVIGLAFVAASGIGFFLYQDQRVDRVAMTNAATRISEPKRAQAQTDELDAARLAMKVQAAPLVADDEAVKEATDRPATELEQALAQERDKTEKLTRELAATRRVLETQTTASAEAGARTADNQQLAILKRALQEAEESAASYQGLLVQERTRTRSLEQQLLAQQEPPPNPANNATAERSVSGATPVQGPDKSAAVPLPSDDTPVVVASANDRAVTAIVAPATHEEPGNPKVTRLMARANQLLAMGDVAAARIVLDRAAELGDTQALFALAETYDPFSLSAWGTLGTQADAAKAQELYAKALAAGIQKARDRIDALRK